MERNVACTMPGIIASPFQFTCTSLLMTVHKFALWLISGEPWGCFFNSLWNRSLTMWAIVIFAECVGALSWFVQELTIILYIFLTISSNFKGSVILLLTVYFCFFMIYFQKIHGFSQIPFFIYCESLWCFEKDSGGPPSVFCSELSFS